MRIRLLYVLLVISVAVAEVPTVAQESEPRVSVGGFVSGLGLFDESGRPKTSPGVGSSLEVHLEGPLVFEGRLAWFPSNEAIEFESQGGRTLELMVGVRGTFLDSRRFRLDGILQPGIVRFSRTATVRPDGSTTIGAKSHLALNLGAGITLFPRSRLSPRVDVGQTSFVVPGSVLYASLPGDQGAPIASASSRAKITDTFDIFAGVNWRLAARTVSTENLSAPHQRRRLMIGPSWPLGCVSPLLISRPFTTPAAEPLSRIASRSMLPPMAHSICLPLSLGLGRLGTGDDCRRSSEESPSG